MKKTIKSFKPLIILLIFVYFLPIFINNTIKVQAATFGPSKNFIGPRERIKDFQRSLLEVMKKGENITIQERYKYLEPNVKETFHFPLMVQIASGNNWQHATDSERLSLVDAFQRMSTMTLAALFNGYNGETFKILSEKKGPQKTTLVSTELVKSDKSRISIIYVTRQFKQGWKIIDVILDKGISELLVRRSEYQKTLKNTGISGLIKLLENKANEISLQ